MILCVKRFGQKEKILSGKVGLKNFLPRIFTKKCTTFCKILSERNERKVDDIEKWFMCQRFSQKEKIHIEQSRLKNFLLFLTSMSSCSSSGRSRKINKRNVGHSTSTSGFELGAGHVFWRGSLGCENSSSAVGPVVVYDSVHSADYESIRGGGGSKHRPWWFCCNIFFCTLKK